MNPRELVEQLSRDGKLAEVMQEACAMYGLELVMSDSVRNQVKLQPGSNVAQVGDSVVFVCGTCGAAHKEVPIQVAMQDVYTYAPSAPNPVRAEQPEGKWVCGFCRQTYTLDVICCHAQRQFQAVYGARLLHRFRQLAAPGVRVDRNRIGQAISDHLCNLSDDGAVTLDPFDARNIDAIVDVVVAALAGTPA